MNLTCHYLAFGVDEVDVVDGTNVCVYCPTNETLAPYNMHGVATPVPGIPGPGFSMQLGSQLTSACVASRVHIAKSRNPTVSKTTLCHCRSLHDENSCPAICSILPLLLALICRG
jgi:hypothetical protein